MISDDHFNTPQQQPLLVKRKPRGWINTKQHMKHTKNLTKSNISENHRQLSRMQLMSKENYVPASIFNCQCCELKYANVTIQN